MGFFCSQNKYNRDEHWKQLLKAVWTKKWVKKERVQLEVQLSLHLQQSELINIYRDIQFFWDPYKHLDIFCTQAWNQK